MRTTVPTFWKTFKKNLFGAKFGNFDGPTCPHLGGLTVHKISINILIKFAALETREKEHNFCCFIREQNILLDC